MEFFWPIYLFGLSVCSPSPTLVFKLSMNYDTLVSIQHLFFVFGGLALVYIISAVLRRFNRRSQPEDRLILRKVLLLYLFIFPMLWIIFIEIPLGYEFEKNLLDDGHKFYIIFSIISTFFGVLSWVANPPERHKKMLIYFLNFVGYSICISAWFALYGISHFGF